MIHKIWGNDFVHPNRQIASIKYQINATNIHTATISQAFFFFFFFLLQIKRPRKVLIVEDYTKLKEP